MTAAPKSSQGTIARADGLWWGLLLLIAWVAVPLGSNRPWSWSLAGCSSALLLLGWAISVFRGRRDIVWLRGMAVPVGLFLMLIVWIGLSTVAGFGTPHPIWDMASQGLGKTLPGRSTLSVESTLVALVRLMSYAAIFWLTFQLCRDRDKAQAMTRWIVGLSVVLAAYGLISYFSAGFYIPWSGIRPGTGDVIATFVNRNHYATFAAIGLLCAIGLAVNSFRAAWTVSDRSQKGLARFTETFLGEPLRYTVAVFMIATAWLQTHSRMGALSGLIGMIVMLLLMWAVGMVKRGAALMTAAIAAFLLLFLVSGSGIWTRIQAHTGPDDRIGLFAIVGDQIEAAPLTGSGYGTFADTFIMYRDLRLPNPLVYQAAHNSYLELASEIGIPAAAAMVIVLLWLAGLCLIGAFRRRKDRIYPVIAVGCSVVVAAHALTDFSLQIPAVAMIYAAILGMGVAQSWSLERRVQ